MFLTEEIKRKALEIGFSKVGITDTQPFSFEIQKRYNEWLNKGFHSGMSYLSRDIIKRLNPSMIFKGAKSIISVAMNYYPGWIAGSTDSDMGFISRYALGYDYHRIITKKLQQLFDYIKRETNGKANGKIFCDTGPLLEKMIAERAGLGWIGKNGALVTKEFGSWVFLGEIVLDIELKYDLPAKNLCSDCNLCIKACPTGAIFEPGVIDTSKCISYLTIENRGEIPIELRERIGNKVFGCDTCQEVCPFNNNAIKTEEFFLRPQKDLLSPPLEKLFTLAYESFEEQFRDSAIKRAKRMGFLRNIVVAMGNSGDRKFLPLLEKALKEEEPMIKLHIEWAIEKLRF